IIVEWDAYDLLLRGLADQPALQAGDVVRVPVRQSLVALTGGVNYAVRVEVREDETLQDLLGAAGGVSPGTEGGVATRMRRGRKGFESSTWAADAWNRATLAPGDSVIINSVVADSALAPTIQLAGAFWAPGAVAWRPGLRLS